MWRGNTSFMGPNLPISQMMWSIVFPMREKDQSHISADERVAINNAPILNIIHNLWHKRVHDYSPYLQSKST